MATRTKAEVVAFWRGASIEGEAEIPLASANTVLAPSTRQELALADIDLTGKPKAWLLIGPNGSGKTALARWMGRGNA